MKNILVLGAGKSATALIEYLLEHAATYEWNITVGDMDPEIAAQKINGHTHGNAIFFDVKDLELLRQTVATHDIVASVLPAEFHYRVAQACIEFGKHLITPSYVSARERELDNEFREKGLLFMGEIGLDPGIDHMSVMRILHYIASENGKLNALRSFCGALIAPESDDNPWHYKFTWAPMNVVLAGQGTAQFLENGKIRYVPYNRLFSQVQRYEVEGYGTFEGYPNRDSLPYIQVYGVEGVRTFMRGTLRRGGYCAAWDAFVKIGLTDNNLLIKDVNDKCYSDLLSAFLPADPKRNLRQRCADFLRLPTTAEPLNKMAWLGFFDDEPILLEQGTPAQLLCDLLARKWTLKANDKDLIVMLHEFEYETSDAKKHKITSTLALKGKDQEHTAIALTVGLPMAIMVKLVATNQITLTGVHIPISPEVYIQMLNELEELGIGFTETHE